mmetsp:Transcript_74708/g.124630  ORF Transcript_74708/g.124630 Transcript_74708/m.124630 type:complete len:382 (+) Transcript_74708:380-1525(+)
MDLSAIRASSVLLNQTQACLDLFSRRGTWVESRWVPHLTSTATPELNPSFHVSHDEDLDLQNCGNFGQLSTLQARQRLKGQHVVVVGDMAARLWYAALVYLVNGTRNPNEVALGFPQHLTAPDAECFWNPERVTRGGYDFGGWGEYGKSTACHLRLFGRPNLNDHPLTLKKATGWWGRGTPRDVMTMLLKPKALYSSWRGSGVAISYLWRGVVRTGGSYQRQHAMLIDNLTGEVGLPPTLIVAAVGTYDSQWQPLEEVAGRIGGMIEGFARRWPPTAKGSPLLLLNSLSSCPQNQRYSVYMGTGTRHGTYRKLPNASALIPHARAAVSAHGALFFDTSTPQLTVPPLRNSPCHYDLPIGVMAEQLVQIVINAIFRDAARPS